MGKIARGSKKVAVGIIGGIVVLAGLVMVPYPGPGWLVVFAGLAILSSEFEFAERLLAFARSKYDAWADWLKRQNWWIQAIVLIATGAVVIITLWLLNAFGLVLGLFQLQTTLPWLVSPFFR